MSYIPRFGSRGSGMLTVGFVVTPGFPVMSLAALSVFEFANHSSGEEALRHPNTVRRRHARPIGFRHKP